MAFELPDGKTARNIQEQVAFLTGKVKELIAFVNQAGLKSIQIVEELPEVGDPTVLYLLEKEDPETGDYYDEYLWIDDAWELIGTTQIDLSDYCTLSTDQTITGVKTINDKLKIGSIWNLKGDTTYFHVYSDSTLEYTYTDGAFFPRAAGKDLGANNASFKWKDLYLSGNAYLGSNYITVDRTVFNFNNWIKMDNTIFRPVEDASIDIGNSSRRFKDLYLSGKAYIGTTSQIYNDASGNLLLSNNNGLVKSNSHIRPDANGTLSLGAGSLKWNYIYCNNISDGTNSSTVENLVKKARLYKHKITTSGGNVINVITPTASAFTDFNPAMIDDCIIAKVGSSTILSYNYGGGQMSDLYYVNYTGTQTSLSLTGQTITTDEISDI